MSKMNRVIGFAGLGQMGGPMAANIAKGGFEVHCFDIAGTDARLPEGGKAAGSLAELVENADTIFLSLPDGKAVVAASEEIAIVDNPKTSVVIDLSTIGPDASREAARILSAKNITFGDAPVSGGRSGAIKGTITLIYAGSRDVFDSHGDVFGAFCGNPFYVGTEPGQGQALKLLNNFLSGTAMVATSEAITYGLSQGLDMKTMLDVVNVSTGANMASKDKFVNRVLTGTYDAGFYTRLLNKDIQLYFDNVSSAGTPSDVGTVVSRLWQGGSDTLPPDADFTRIFDYIRERKKQQ